MPASFLTLDLLYCVISCILVTVHNYIDIKMNALIVHQHAPIYWFHTRYEAPNRLLIMVLPQMRGKLTQLTIHLLYTVCDAYKISSK